DEKVVAHALPKIEVGLQVAERQLSHRQGFLLGGEVTLADLLPAAAHPFVRAYSRGPDDVRALSGSAGLGRTDGGLADRAAVARGAAADLAGDRARQEVARLAPAEILRSCEKTATRGLPARGRSSKLCP